MSPGGAAKMLGVTLSRVQQLSRDGTLPTIYDSGGRRIFLEREVIALRDRRLAKMRAMIKSIESVTV